jgi:hypothetical protein
LTLKPIIFITDIYIYVGKDSDGNTLDENDRKFSKPTQSVLRLTKPINKTNRNITADNWFTSIELIEELKKKREYLCRYCPKK